jgi:hypothetical protein
MICFILSSISPLTLTNKIFERVMAVVVIKWSNCLAFPFSIDRSPSESKIKILGAYSISLYLIDAYIPLVQRPALIWKLVPNKAFMRVDLPVLYGPIIETINAGFISPWTSNSLYSIFSITFRKKSSLIVVRSPSITSNSMPCSTKSAYFYK